MSIHACLGGQWGWTSRGQAARGKASWDRVRRWGDGGLGASAQGHLREVGRSRQSAGWSGHEQEGSGPTLVVTTMKTELWGKDRHCGPGAEAPLGRPGVARQQPGRRVCWSATREGRLG